MVELRSQQLSDANLSEYKNNNLSYYKLREAEGTRGIIPIRHEKKKHGAVDRYCSAGSMMLPRRRPGRES